MFRLKPLCRKLAMAPPNRRNERERNRVKQVNQGFAMLRSHIPAIANSKKLSKVITLRSAVDYIRTLERLLHDDHPPPFMDCSPQFAAGHHHQHHHLHQSTHAPQSGGPVQVVPQVASAATFSHTSATSTSGPGGPFDRADRIERLALQENTTQAHHASPVSAGGSASLSLSVSSSSPSASSSVEMSPAASSVDLQVFADHWHGWHCR